MSIIYWLRPHLITKINTYQAFQKDIYENGKALLCPAMSVTTLRKFIFENGSKFS